MEKYIGKKLIFETKDSTLIGILIEISKKEGKFVIQKEDNTTLSLNTLSLTKIMIHKEEIENLKNKNTTKEIESKKEGIESKKEGIDIKKEGIDIKTDTSNKENRNENINKDNKNNRNENPNKEYINKENRNRRSLKAGLSTFNNKRTPTELENLIKSKSPKKQEKQEKPEISKYEKPEISKYENKEKQENKENKEIHYLSDIRYEEFLNSIFNFYGPPEDGFISIATQNILKIILLTSFKSVKEGKVSILIGKDSIYSRIALNLAKILPLHNIDSQVKFASKENISIKTEIYKYFFINSLGRIVSNIDITTDLLIIAGEDFTFDDTNHFIIKKTVFKDILYLNIPSKKDDFNSKRKCCVCYGSVPEKYKNFDGSVLCLDVCLSEEIYKKFNIDRISKKNIFKVKD
ncbi:DUF5096 domain-containing protein [Hamiltosporidium tvaerminnensis]|uniref:DUF5096 domain-containing protein n=1 Tax=Hamiltosporidium tvaerminnensis TaxID=1176355 RepID=A0A4Q9M2M4_9MICR|nr:DUF5096 domain-containing protein [Hamiltosporidium tvaerminnensis]